MSTLHSKKTLHEFSGGTKPLGRTIFKRSPLLYSGTYPTLFWLMAFIYVLQRRPVIVGPAIALFLFFVIFFYGVGVQQYYFIATESQLVIRNHWFFWKVIKLDWGDIMSVRFSGPEPSKSSKGIPWEAGIWVRTDSRSYTFRSGSLKESDIHELIGVIEARRKRS